MKIMKYQTKNLACYYAKDSVGNDHYQIYEIGEYDIPICIYVDRNTIHLSEKLSEDITTYKFFEELRELIKNL